MGSQALSLRLQMNSSDLTLKVVDLDDLYADDDGFVVMWYELRLEHLTCSLFCKRKQIMSFFKKYRGSCLIKCSSEMLQNLPHLLGLLENKDYNTSKIMWFNGIKIYIRKCYLMSIP